MMVRIDRVVTKGGDRGETSLGNGRRVRKDSLRIEAIGAVDEANAALGLFGNAVANDGPTAEWVRRIQNDLFDLGADLAAPEDDGKPRIRIQESQVQGLEETIEARNEGLPPLRSFILPGGSAAAGSAHLARAIVRRAERRLVALAAAEPLNPVALRYLNRLSDLLFVLSRAENEKTGQTLLWKPGGEATG
ncbi:MAG: cob(I)yrinic acid a,c-diamide adenosyltransferase [Acetobacteraceae bacterium]